MDKGQLGSHMSALAHLGTKLTDTHDSPTTNGHWTRHVQPMIFDAPCPPSSGQAPSGSSSCHASKRMLSHPQFAPGYADPLEHSKEQRRDVNRSLFLHPLPILLGPLPKLNRPVSRSASQPTEVEHLVSR